MKIKTTVVKKIASEVEKEITLPYYCQDGSCFLKVESETRVIVVKTFDFHTTIEIANFGYHSTIYEATPITKKEFNEAFDKAFSAIQQLQEVLS